MLLEKDAAVDIVPIPAEFLLDYELWHVKHDLWAELMDLKKLNNWLRVPRVLSVYQCFEVEIQAALPLIGVPFRHEQFLWRESWQVLIAEKEKLLVQLKELVISLPNRITDLTR